MFSIRNVQLFLDSHSGFTREAKTKLLREATAKSEKGMLHDFRAYEIFGTNGGNIFLSIIAKDEKHILINTEDTLKADQFP